MNNHKSDEDRHGWENKEDREEALRQLEYLAEHATKVMKGRNCKRISSVLRTYKKLYQEGRENELRKGIECLIPVEDKLGYPKDAAEGAISGIKKLLNKYYRSREGGRERCQIYFVDDVMLGIRINRHYLSSSKALKGGAILFSAGKPHFKLSFNRPYVLAVMAFAAAGIMAVASMAMQAAFRDNAFMYNATLLITPVVAAPLVLGIAMKLVPRWRFIHVFLRSMFLRYEGKELSLAPYVGVCSVPECGGTVNLTKERYKDGSRCCYIAECKKNPRWHVYAFNHVTMKGERLSG